MAENEVFTETLLELNWVVCDQHQGSVGQEVIGNFGTRAGTTIFIIGILAPTAATGAPGGKGRRTGRSELNPQNPPMSESSIGCDPRNGNDRGCFQGPELWIPRYNGGIFQNCQRNAEAVCIGDWPPGLDVGCHQRLISIGVHQLDGKLVHAGKGLLGPFQAPFAFGDVEYLTEVNDTHGDPAATPLCPLQDLSDPSPSRRTLQEGEQSIVVEDDSFCYQLISPWMPLPCVP